ncbi:hypothetical protein HDU86_008486 [Geranomyces michiganensis]|nr:hypothetical protein HDU86_008486 [Geranomyces michiganensis]
MSDIQLTNLHQFLLSMQHRDGSQAFFSKPLEEWYADYHSHCGRTDSTPQKLTNGIKAAWETRKQALYVPTAATDVDAAQVEYHAETSLTLTHDEVPGSSLPSSPTPSRPFDDEEDKDDDDEDTDSEDTDNEDTDNNDAEAPDQPTLPSNESLSSALKLAGEKLVGVNDLFRTGIIDLDDPAVIECLGAELHGEVHRQQVSAQSWQGHSWEYFETTGLALEILDRLSQIPTASLTSIALQGCDNGPKWLLDKIFALPLTHSRPFAQARSSTRARKLSPTTTTNSTRILDDDARHILRRLIDIIDIIVEDGSLRDLSERGGDAAFYWSLFRVVKPKTDMHNGEVESRASRQRRVDAKLQDNPEANTSRIRGCNLDYLFCKDDRHSNLGWGAELGAAANVGQKRNRKLKAIGDRTGLATVLRDMHYSLAKRIHASDYDEAVVHHLPMHGILVQNWVLTHIVVTHITGRYYAVQTIDRAQIPTELDSNLGHFFADSLELVLRFRDGLAFTREVFLSHDDSGRQGTDEGPQGEMLPPIDYLSPDVNTPAKRPRRA